MKIKETDGYKEFNLALIKLKQGFIGMSLINEQNWEILNKLKDVEKKVVDFGNLEFNNGEYKDEQYESLLEAIENKDEDGIKRLEDASKNGKTIRIM